MNRISNAFNQGKAFISFLTAGDPSIARTEEYILTLANAGSDLIEIGIPFSDPIAEGKVIESANIRALSNGTTLKQIFAMVKRVRQKTKVPLVFLSYLNPIFVYGLERFFISCKASEIDGIIIPDLPYEEKAEVLIWAEKYGIDLITLIAPTSKQRIHQLAAAATGFIYLVSSMGVTGVRSEIKTDIEAIIAEIREVSSTPIAVGFGISTAEQVARMVRKADGVIIGSAIVKLIEQQGESASESLATYVKAMKEAIS